MFSLCNECKLSYPNNAVENSIVLPLTISFRANLPACYSLLQTLHASRRDKRKPGNSALLSSERFFLLFIKRRFALIIGGFVEL